ncbi:hypothetical protein C0993_012543 [Termitomyces sp. T159_Od127]|nr:hypothetical protein C0993_012543 [Termitomyces sp. T159_Od127]
MASVKLSAISKMPKNGGLADLADSTSPEPVAARLDPLPSVGDASSIGVPVSSLGNIQNPTALPDVSVPILGHPPSSLGLPPASLTMSQLPNMNTMSIPQLPCTAPAESFLTNVDQFWYMEMESASHPLPSQNSILADQADQVSMSVLLANPAPLAAPGSDSDSVTMSHAALMDILHCFGLSVAQELLLAIGLSTGESTGVSAPPLPAVGTPPPVFGPIQGASFLLNAPSSCLGITPLVALSGSRPLLSTLPVEAGELDPNVLPIPLCIQQVFNAGWSTYVPLDLLTNAACYRALIAADKHGNSAVSLSATEELQVLGTQFDLSQERHLSPFEFLQASKTLVWVIH